MAKLALQLEKGSAVVKINKNITIHYLGMKNGEAKLGIEAPRSVHIIRAELERNPHHHHKRDNYK